PGRRRPAAPRRKRPQAQSAPRYPDPPTNIGRDVHGRFTFGNPGGPGNPFARKCAALRKALLDAVSEEDIMDMARVLVLRAKTGDKEAVKLLWQYVIGKPTAPKDPDRMDIEEWRWLQDMRVPDREFTETPESVPACFASHLTNVTWACNVETSLRQPVFAEIHKMDERDA